MKRFPSYLIPAVWGFCAGIALMLGPYLLPPLQAIIEFFGVVLRVIGISNPFAAIVVLSFIVFVVYVVHARKRARSTKIQDILGAFLWFYGGVAISFGVWVGVIYLAIQNWQVVL